MKLIFFDIECAGVHKTYAKICAFGYVVCDGQFNILEKEDILINPRGRFELTNRKGEKRNNSTLRVFGIQKATVLPRSLRAHKGFA